MIKNRTNQATQLAIRSYLGHIWKERRFALPALLLPGIGNIFSIYAPPLIVAGILSEFGQTKPTLEQLIPYLIAFAAVWFIGEILWRIAFLFLSKAESTIIHKLYTSAMQELTKKDIGFFHNNFAGALTKKAVGYGRSFEGFFDTLTFNIVGNLIPLIFVVVVLWQFSPLLVAALLGLLCVSLAFIIPLTKIRKKLVDQREEASNKMAGYVADVIGNMDAVQAFAHEDFEIAQHKKLSKDYMSKALRSWNFHTLRIDTVISPIYVLINVVGLTLAVALSSDTASFTSIFITFNFYAYTTRVLWEFNRIYRNLENALTEAAQFTEILLIPPTLAKSRSPLNLKITQGEIEFKNVDFAYPSAPDKLLFKNLQLRITAGEKLALVGHSGGGKSTITKILLRFVDVVGGELLIDGQNVADGKLRDLRSSIAYVPQDPAMFHRSIKENIRYGKPNATDHDIEVAARKAHAHEFITQLPEGYDTLVGERGVKLSGGQRQRIAIARAIIKDAPILVLDEATSALDSESEKYIQIALRELMKSRTTIVIAHRLSTIQKMDRIVVLDNGTIAEQGTHSELLEQKGIYAQLWAHQSGGFIEE
jgi:ATP-binding cassette subfamily B protein